MLLRDEAALVVAMRAGEAEYAVAPGAEPRAGQVPREDVLHVTPRAGIVWYTGEAPPDPAVLARALALLDGDQPVELEACVEASAFVGRWRRLAAQGTAAPAVVSARARPGGWSLPPPPAGADVWRRALVCAAAGRRGRPLNPAAGSPGAAFTWYVLPVETLAVVNEELLPMVACCLRRRLLYDPVALFASEREFAARLKQPFQPDVPGHYLASDGLPGWLMRAVGGAGATAVARPAGGAGGAGGGPDAVLCAGRLPSPLSRAEGVRLALPPSPARAPRAATDALAQCADCERPFGGPWAGEYIFPTEPPGEWTCAWCTLERLDAEVTRLRAVAARRRQVAPPLPSPPPCHYYPLRQKDNPAYSLGAAQVLRVFPHGAFIQGPEGLICIGVGSDAPLRYDLQHLPAPPDLLCLLPTNLGTLHFVPADGAATWQGD